MFTGQSLQPGDFLAGALSLKITRDQGDAELAAGGIQLGLDPLHIIRVGDQQRGVSEGFHKITQIKQLVFSLNIFRGADEHFSHGFFLLKVL
ncbi:hypothetical protein D3C75_875920 [compost metagenome]